MRFMTEKIVEIEEGPSHVKLELKGKIEKNKESRMLKSRKQCIVL